MYVCMMVFTRHVDEINVNSVDVEPVILYTLLIQSAKPNSLDLNSRNKDW